MNGPWTRKANIDQPLNFKVAVYDFGVKFSILRALYEHGCELRVFPANTSADEVLAWNPDGIFLSNGPGDPEPVDYAVSTVKSLLGKKPIFGICLGHQILGLALGAKTTKLKFGHHGANHPVKHLPTGAVEITSQNHGFIVDAESLPPKRGRGHPCQLKRRDPRRLSAPEPAGVFRAVPSGVRPRSPRQPVSF